MDVAIVILNHNGKHFLEQCVPSVLRACLRYGQPVEVVVIDNGSIDSSRDYLRNHFPQVRLIAFEENMSFTKAMNKGINQVHADIIIGLNNDVVVDENFILPLIKPFEERKDLFAVGAKMLFLDTGKLNFARAKGTFKYGFFSRDIVDAASICPTLYACAGGFAVAKDKFIALGGFDEDLIVYWEDLDLCYRAWKRGYRCLYQPRSIIYHKFHGTNKDLMGQKGIDRLSGENYFLFTVKNFHDDWFLYRQFFFLPLLLCVSCLRGKAYFAQGLIRAMSKLDVFSRKRALEAEYAFCSDKEVLKISGAA